jgi:dipeptidyl aminopeptidase/acylaminoacyl peptidase
MTTRSAAFSLALSLRDPVSGLCPQPLPRRANQADVWGSLNYGPAWTPDGQRIAFESNKEGPLNIFWQAVDGSGGLERLNTGDYTQAPRSFSPDGRLIAFIEISPTNGYDIWVLQLGDHKAQPFLRTPFNESAPAFSPDGHWLAYISDESGRIEVPYREPGGKY